jgi:hypothetical protein
MKIFLCGTQGCKKSEILSLVETTYVKKKGLTNEMKREVELQFDNKEFIHFQIELLIHSVSDWLKSDDFICSNSIFNIMAYIKNAIDVLNGETGKIQSETENYNLKKITQLMIMVDDFCDILHKNKDNILYFYIPVQFEVGHDDLYQRRIQHYIEFLLKRSGIDYVTLNGDTENKIKTIKSYIG